jgi:Spy/CpxP family protein refolding chaperone
MRNTRRLLSLAAVFTAVTAVPAALYAQQPHGPSGSMMRGGMMGGGQMMERMGGMMDHCGAMMQGGSRGDRPNDQWRRNPPTAPNRDH